MPVNLYMPNPLDHIIIKRFELVVYALKTRTSDYWYVLKKLTVSGICLCRLYDILI